MLLVDDEPDLRDLFTIRLTRAGFDVLVAADGVEALRLWQDAGPKRPALILTDWSMPYIDGLELARLIRADPVAGTVPIVLFTAYLPGSETELAELDVHYLSKSARWDELEPLIAELIS